MASRPVDLRGPLRAALGCVLLATLGVAPRAEAKLRVVASLPDVGDITRQIGGDRVSVETIAKGSQDPHKVPVKPSFVTKLNRADALVVQGLTLEHAYLPALLQVASNPKILQTGPAYIDASIYVTPVDVPTSQNRAQGELHPLGNPHINLDPENAKLMAKAIAEGLTRVDPAGAATYQAGLQRFDALIDQKMVGWEKLAAPLKGVKAVSYHEDMAYFARRFGLEMVGTIETKPGVPATPTHLEELIDTMKRDHVQLVIHEVAYELPLAQKVADETGSRLVTFSPLAGGMPGTSDSYVDNIEADLKALVAAVQGGVGG
jgi:zinc/manganese transport system substrate-binding protein